MKNRIEWIENGDFLVPELVISDSLNHSKSQNMDYELVGKLSEIKKEELNSEHLGVLFSTPLSNLKNKFAVLGTKQSATDEIERGFKK